MKRKNDSNNEEYVRKQIEHGYSERAAEEILRWYHTTENGKKIITKNI